MPKTPISYYGGKQNMVATILPLIPKHRIYTEPFFGGGAIFFAKEKSDAETINDVHNLVVNFYEVVKSDFSALKTKIENTLFSRASYKVALSIYKMPHLFDKIQQAWAFYIGTNMGFSCQIGSWGYDRYGVQVKSFINKKLKFNEEIYKRLEQVQIEHNDANKVIQSRDAVDAFHYVDPPYFNSCQSFYSGYTQEDYRNLLETLSNIKGKFLLSGYPSQILEEYTQKNGWHTRTFNKPLSAKKGVTGKSRGRKIEVLTANYSLSEKEEHDS